MIKNAKRLICCLLIAALCAFTACTGEEKDTYVPYDENLRIEDTRTLGDNEFTQLNTVGTDDYGRTVAAADGKKDKYVGMFFFLTLGQHTDHNGHYDISKITNYGSEYENFQVDNERSPLGSAHFWGEPVWGYYNSLDPWVMRRQIEMLTMIGVDFICFDVSNAVLYERVTDVLLPIMEEYRLKGWNVPKFMYYLANFDNYKNNLKTLYEKIYKPAKYKELWFAPEGKPFVTKPVSFAFDTSDSLEKAMSETFSFKNVLWPTWDNDDEGLPWMEFEFDTSSGRGQPRQGDWISVSVAQHVTVRFSDTVGTHGRGYDFATGLNDHENFRKGANYQSQWDSAIKYGDDVKYIFLTGWNEWVAGKLYDGTNYFTVDTFDEEFSRDLEPCRNGYGDNFYLQTAMNIKRAAYSEPKHYIYGKSSADINDFENEEQWENAATYLDFTGEAVKRDFRPMCATFPNYVNESNRNDIASVKVVRDDEFVYFKIQTVDDITPHTSGDTGWMNLLIKTKNAKNSTYGYNFIVNTAPGNDGYTDVRRADGKTFAECGAARYTVSGNTMMLKIKLKDLGLSAANYDIEFKVADNVGDYSDYLNFYDCGDAAPIGRLNYSYGY